MKKQLALKYPHSANLFRFCRRVLDHKLGGARVIDQDVGQLLGFDPADCSHWKKGKKNIQSIYAMRNIAHHLGVDEKLVSDLASGDIDDEDAYCEFLGYGETQIDAKILDSAKKDFFKHHASRWSRDREQEFRNSFAINTTRIVKLVQEIHERINFQEAPLYLPEVTAYYPEIVLEDLREDTPWKQTTVQTRLEKNSLVITYKHGTELKPYIRFRIAKMMSLHFLEGPKLSPELKEYEQSIWDIESNIFASHLLAPETLIRKEIAKIEIAKDLSAQLAEIFWVSKSFMNLRLKETLKHN